MNSEIRKMLEGVRQGTVSVDDALLALKKEPFTDIGYAKVDLHRGIRQGAAEVIYGAGKTPAQMIGIIGVMRRESSAMSFSDVERTVVVPISLAQQMFGYGRTIHLLALAGYKDVPSKQVEKAAREAVFARHMISPDDEKAAWTMSAGEMFDLSLIHI